MYFDIADPYGMSDAYLGIEEVRTRSGVEHTLVDDLKFAAIDSTQLGSAAPHFVLPDMLHQHFHTSREVTHFPRNTGMAGRRVELRGLRGAPRDRIFEGEPLCGFTTLSPPV